MPSVPPEAPICGLDAPGSGVDAPGHEAPGNNEPPGHGKSDAPIPEPPGHEMPEAPDAPT